ncbi:hypothetical protein [Moosepox virus GoldyGopher14]|nr:hypothetical protein [Moosepox virus GoldyGopher14]
MGIKNLKTLLLEIGALRKISNIPLDSINGIFVDTMSFFVSIAHCVNNLDDLNDMFFTYINQWARYGKVTLFVDRGNIIIKESLREKRRITSKNTTKRKVEEVDKLNNDIKLLDSSYILYEEMKTDIELRIKKLSFHNFLANSNNLKAVLEKSLSLLSDNVKVIYCDGIDAEFVMCREAKNLSEMSGKWPLLISTDQDILLLSSCDSFQKIIKTMNQMYLFLPCSKTRYLSKLVALTNGCDYFPGLHGFSITTKSLEHIPLFDDFVLDNIIQSLVIKNYTKKESDRNINVDTIITFIDRYSKFDNDIYFSCPLDSVTIQEFIFSALSYRWKKFDDTLLKGISLCASLICILEPKKEIVKEDINYLCKIINDNDKTNINHIRSILDIFGYEMNKGSDITLGILNLKNIMLCFNDIFYFNNEIIIKHNYKNNIINIG